jgi:hypothetical protein
MRLIWVHHDCLHHASPAYRAHPDAPSLFVWDDAQLYRDAWSLKRIGFVYECLLDLPVIIRRGDPLTEVRRFMDEAKCSSVVTMATPDPYLMAQARELKAEILECESFVSVKGSLDLRRFSHYWSAVHSQLLGKG